MGMKYVMKMKEIKSVVRMRKMKKLRQVCRNCDEY